MKKIDKQIEEYLFDTNFRWMAIKTKIVNRMPLASWEYEEYNQIREKTISLLSSQRDELVKELEDMPINKHEVHYYIEVEGHKECIKCYAIKQMHILARRYANKP